MAAGGGGAPSHALIVILLCQACDHYSVTSVEAAAVEQLVPATQAEWCAQGMGMPVESMLEMCCNTKGIRSPCFDVVDQLGNKCCRHHTHAGFYGYLIPFKAFARTPPRVLEAPRNKSLWSLDNFHALSSNANTGTEGFTAMHREIVSLGAMSDDHGTETDSLRLLMLPTSPPLAEVVKIKTPNMFFYKLFHEYAETAQQGIWERARFIKHASEFERHLEQRSFRRYGVYKCDQFEAGRDRIMADTDVAKWIADRWIFRGHSPLRSFVNLGARNGLNDDPFATIFSKPEDVSFALAVEMDPAMCSEHEANFPHVRVLCTRITVETVADIIEQLPESSRSAGWKTSSWSEKQDGVPLLGGMPALDMLKVDLDGADCDILQSFLRLAPAKFVITEVYDGIPPPFRFALHESGFFSRLPWEGEGRPEPWGCSLSYQVHLLGSFGFDLIWYGAGNAVFAHRSTRANLGLPGPLDEVDCYAQSVIMSMWPDGRTMRKWFYEETVEDVLDEIRSMLEDPLRGLAYTLSV